MKARGGVLAVGLVAALLAGCGDQGGGESAVECPKPPKNVRELEVTIGGWEGPEELGILMAEERGFFDQTKLDVSVYVAAEPARAVTYVADGSVDIGITHLPQVALANEKGAPVVAVGSLIPQSTAAMIWLKDSQIEDIADLKGKTIAIPGLSFQKDFLEAVLKGEGLTLGDVAVKNVAYDLVPALVGGRADAIFGGSANIEGAELESRGLEPVVAPVEDAGVPPFDEVVAIARSDRLDEAPESICNFVAAVARGAATAVEHPHGAVEAIEGSVESNPDLRSEALAAQVDATLPLLSTNGHLDSAQASHLVDWMYGQGMIERKLSTSGLLGDDFPKEEP
jgi:putative hydroxymethylpyrimidine transport system substrate-binding protein